MLRHGAMVPLSDGYDLGVSINGGSPIAGRLIVENLVKMDDFWGLPPISGNLHFAQGSYVFCLIKYVCHYLSLHSLLMLVDVSGVEADAC